jgi:hypothetical protein
MPPADKKVALRVTPLEALKRKGKVLQGPESSIIGLARRRPAGAIVGDTCCDPPASRRRTCLFPTYPKQSGTT